MAQMIKARNFLAHAPREALADAAGLVVICVLIFAGLTLPAMF
ncbi:MAG: hypothetical protein RQ752_02405 [Thermohalobaculum sp.]|nr:hypothetical protein [Thermohalobaculum sp.]